MILYKHIQYGKLLITILSVLTIFPLVLLFTKTDNLVMPKWALVLIISVIVITILLFYKLTITISTKKIKANFGIGIIKRSMAIKDIDYNTIEELNLSGLYGIGIRLTPHGILYNVKIGKAIKIKSDKKTFFVGTDDYDTIYSILLKLKQ